MEPLILYSSWFLIVIWLISTPSMIVQCISLSCQMGESYSFRQGIVDGSLFLFPLILMLNYMGDKSFLPLSPLLRLAVAIIFFSLWTYAYSTGVRENTFQRHTKWKIRQESAGPMIDAENSIRGRVLRRLKRAKLLVPLSVLPVMTYFLWIQNFSATSVVIALVTSGVMLTITLWIFNKTMKDYEDSSSVR